MLQKGIHGRNSEYWTRKDLNALHIINPRWIKMMSNTHPSVFNTLKVHFPNVQLITRLFHPTKDVGAMEFVNWITPVIHSLLPYCRNYQIWNEPNHPTAEGYDSSEQSAQRFTNWFMVVIKELRSRFPNTLFGFPALAVPHNDLKWIEICKPAIDASDWLGAHSYWQNPSSSDSNHLSAEWGLRFQQYHILYPNKPIHILEAGNTNHQSNLPTDEHTIAVELEKWGHAIRRYSYVKSASPFLLSSPDPYWNEFVFVDEGGYIRERAYRWGAL